MRILWIFCLSVFTVTVAMHYQFEVGAHKKAIVDAQLPNDFVDEVITQLRLLLYISERLSFDNKEVFFFEKRPMADLYDFSISPLSCRDLPSVSGVRDAKCFWFARVVALLSFGLCARDCPTRLLVMKYVAYATDFLANVLEDLTYAQSVPELLHNQDLVKQQLLYNVDSLHRLLIALAPLPAIRVRMDEFGQDDLMGDAQELNILVSVEHRVPDAMYKEWYGAYLRGCWQEGQSAFELLNKKLGIYSDVECEHSMCAVKKH